MYHLIVSAWAKNSQFVLSIAGSCAFICCWAAMCNNWYSNYVAACRRGPVDISSRSFCAHFAPKPTQPSSNVLGLAYASFSSQVGHGLVCGLVSQSKHPHNTWEIEREQAKGGLLSTVQLHTPHATHQHRTPHPKRRKSTTKWMANTNNCGEKWRQRKGEQNVTEENYQHAHGCQLQ